MSPAASWRPGEGFPSKPSVAALVKASREHTQSHEESAARLGGAARELAREAQILREAVSRFRI